MLSHLDLHTSRVQAIDVIRSSQCGSEPAPVETIFVWLGEQANRYATRPRSQQRVADPYIRESIHRQIDLLVFLIDLRDGACAVILRRILIGHEIYRWIDRVRWIFARQRPGDVG